MDGKNVLGLIPARGGSKTLPNKNISNLGGTPLIGWVCQAAKKAKNISQIILSTDDLEIQNTAEKYGIKSPFKRPPELAQDNSLVVEVIIHALNWMKTNQNVIFDYVCLLQPTSPFATPEDYDTAIDLAYQKNADTVISVYPCDQRHPSIMFTMEENNKANWFMTQNGKSKMSRRQDLPDIYMRAGIVYVIKVDHVVKEKNIYGEKLFAINVPESRAIGIDTKQDLDYAEFLVQRNKLKPY